MSPCSLAQVYTATALIIVDLAQYEIFCALVCLFLGMDDITDAISQLG